MPYSIQTEDGITVDDIPDTVKPDAPELKARVASIRSGREAAPADRAPVTDEQALATSARMKGERQQAEASSRKHAADEYAGGDVSQMGPLQRGRLGAKASMDRTAFNLKSALPKSVQQGGDTLNAALGGDTLDENTVRRAKAFEEEGGDAAKRGGFIADFGLTLPLGMGATSMLRSGTAQLPRVLGTLARGAGELASGGGLGYLTADPEHRGKGAAGGVLGSAIGALATRLTGGAVRPMMSDEALALQRRGIQPTVGQSVGGHLNKWEQKSTSMPFHGDSVADARNRGADEWVNATIREAAPGVRGVGDDALRDAHGVLDRQYSNAMSLMPQHFTVDSNPILHAAVTAVDNPQLGLSREAQGRVLEWVQQNLLNRSRNLTPEIAKRIESDMGQLVRNWKASVTGEERVMGQALDDVHQQWRNSLTAVGDSTGRGAGSALREADAAWRAFRAVDRAGASSTAQAAEIPGRYTPRALRGAIAAEDKSQFDRTTRYGNLAPNSPMGRLNELAREGERVVPDRVPNSGTTDRAGMWSLTKLPVAAALLASWPVTAALYSRIGQQALTRGVRPALDALANSGAAGAQAARLIEQYGPDAVLQGMRTAAAQQQQPPQQGAPNAAQ